ncbi:MAG: UvrD-helicase domain-containing protein, partial [Limisphaerales bacterium]
MSAPTPQQKTAIDSDGNVLVMAGAGAGKTSTLVARILDRTLDSPHRTPINRLLVVTFNEAAAAEMRHRLGIAFDARLRGDPDNTWIAEQRALLDTAFVSTLHAFCLRLVREHFHELDLDPQFSVQDAIQTRIQRQEVLSDLLRSHLENSPAQSRPIRAWLTRHARDQLDRLRNRILEVHEFARSLPEPRNWLEDQLRGFRDEFPHRWVALAGPGIAEWASSWIDHAREVALLDHSNRPAQICVHALGGLADTPQTFSHLECLLADVVEAGDATGAEKKQVARWLKPLKKLIGEADALLQFLAPADPSVGGPNALSQDWEWCRHDAATLLELVNEFDHAFAEARRAAAVVDFADLEQLALRLLWDSETRQPSRLALQWQADLDHVFVDEVQDINGAQDRILQCLSRTGARSNRFLVGDVKQSIYRFRRADPRIFQTYARDWRSSPHHAVAPLTDNFRSHQAILHFVNEVFRPIMRKCAGGIVYDADAELQLGAPADRPHFRDHPDGRVEFHLLVTHASDGPPTNEDETTSASASASTDSSEADDETGDLDAEESQAKLAAHRLRALRDSASPVWDASSRATRPVQWRDMVVLHPAPRSVSERWARAFANEDVPLDARRGGFFESLEVSDLVQLVRLLDNPRQDLPLLAVLRSPLVQMSVDELALLRILNPTLPLWPALQALARPPANPPSLTPDRPESPSADPSADPELGPLIASARAKAHAFLEAHSRWRRIATQGSLAACLETVLAETDYEARLLAQDRADAKRANLHRLLGLSRQFDSFQRHGLFRFIQFLESQASSAETLESAPAASGDSVRLLSIHQSKGLEFPIVVVAGLGRRFNEESLRSDWLLDPDFGVCPPVVPDVRASRYPSLPRWLAGHRQRHELLGEQIRLLYVAFTRAAERLLLIASARESRLAAWSESGGHIPTRSLLEARSPIDWLGPQLPGIARADDFYSRDSGRSGFLDWRLWRS